MINEFIFVSQLIIIYGLMGMSLTYFIITHNFDQICGSILSGCVAMSILIPNPSLTKIMNNNGRSVVTIKRIRDQAV